MYKACMRCGHLINNNFIILKKTKRVSQQFDDYLRAEKIERNYRVIIRVFLTGGAPSHHSTTPRPITVPCITKWSSYMLLICKKYKRERERERERERKEKDKNIEKMQCNLSTKVIKPYKASNLT
jgi:hypothetical protein